MTCLNQFLIHKSDAQRRHWLHGFLRKVCHGHRRGQAASLMIQTHDNDQLTLSPCQGTSVNSHHQAVDNLLDCLTRLYPRYDRYLPALWPDCPFLQDYPALSWIETQVYRRRKAREKQLKHCFADNAHFSVSKSWHHFQVVARKQDSPALRQLLQAPDRAIDRGQLLKDCKATTVSLYTLSGGRKVIIKRYNSKGTAYSLRRSLIDSRARVCWRGALLLDQIGISTPENLAMLEVRQGPWIKTSYLVTAFTPGESLSALYNEGCQSPLWPAMARQLEDILLTYPRVRVAHGDFKSTNFIVGDDQPVTIDLDSIRSFRLARLFRDTYLRDLERFQRNWGHSPSATALFTPMIEQIRQTCLSTQP